MVCKNDAFYERPSGCILDQLICSPRKFRCRLLFVPNERRFMLSLSLSLKKDKNAAKLLFRWVNRCLRPSSRTFTTIPQEYPRFGSWFSCLAGHAHPSSRVHTAPQKVIHVHRILCGRSGRPGWLWCLSYCAHHHNDRGCRGEPHFFQDVTPWGYLLIIIVELRSWSGIRLVLQSICGGRRKYDQRSIRTIQSLHDGE